MRLQLVCFVAMTANSRVRCSSEVMIELRSPGLRNPGPEFGLVISVSHEFGKESVQGGPVSIPNHLYYSDGGLGIDFHS